MTYHPPNIIFYGEEEYELLKNTPSQLPMFDLLGVHPNIESSTVGNHQAHYVIEASTLYLKTVAVMYIFLSDDDLLKTPTEDDLSRLAIINGVQADVREPWLLYENINFRLPYTGTILIAREPMDVLPSVRRKERDYKIVFSLKFTDGKLQDIDNLSSTALTRNRL
jgi:hypothetical protein